MKSLRLLSVALLVAAAGCSRQETDPHLPEPVQGDHAPAPVADGMMGLAMFSSEVLVLSRRDYATIDGKRESNCLTQPRKGIPAGGQLSTAGDMYRFAAALIDGRLVPKALFQQATTPYRGPYGLGFFATDYTPDHPPRDLRWGHGGSSDGACTDVRTYPRTGETVIVLSNRDAPVCFAVARFLHRQQLLAK